MTGPRLVRRVTGIIWSFEEDEVEAAERMAKLVIHLVEQSILRRLKKRLPLEIYSHICRAMKEE